MRVEKRKKRGRKKAAFPSLQSVEFDMDAIREIKRRKRGLSKRRPKRKG